MKTIIKSKSVELKEVQYGGLADREPKYFADGKRVSRSDFNDIKSIANRLECFSNAQVNGVWTFYCTARFD